MCSLILYWRIYAYVNNLQQKHKELQAMEAKVDEMRGRI